jgi:enoyl-CoA hydratase/carnithine racemase
MTHRYVETEEVDGVLVITMSDPPTRNAIGTEMASEITGELDRLEASADLRALVLTGRDPSFCSGANVKQMDKANRDASEGPNPRGLTPWEHLERTWAESSRQDREAIDSARNVPLRLHSLQKPSIAAINGHAMGLGLGIALSCDVRIASERARMAETFVRRGLIPADGSCWQLPRMIGLGNTLLMQYTGDVIDAAEALRLGIVSKVTSHENLMAATMELAERLAGGATYSMAMIKRLVQRSLNESFGESMRLAGLAQGIARRTDDHHEGVRAFVEKRQPRFTGR